MKVKKKRGTREMRLNTDSRMGRSGREESMDSCWRIGGRHCVCSKEDGLINS